MPLVKLESQEPTVSDHHSRNGTAPWAVGMVLVRASRDLQAEAYSQELIAGLDESISTAGGTFLVKIVPDEASERATYQQWAASEHIRSVVIEDFTVSDTRRPFLEGLGLEVTVFGDVTVAGDRPVIWTDHAGAMRLAIEALYEAGHRVIARVSGPIHFHHSLARSAAFFESGAALGMSVTEALGDYSRQSGAAATRKVLEADERITAILFDNDLMALGGLALLNELGKIVPDDISIVAWDDSVRGQMSTPPLAALSHDVRQIGQIAGHAVVQTHAGTIMRAATPLPTFVKRGSLGPPRESKA
jgi:LacI family repressor for deo operon, udp, cdd, tsx, nupC, and nupG